MGGLAVSRVAGAGVGVNQAAVTRAQLQAGAASINVGGVRCAKGGGVGALDLQGAQVV